MATISAELRNHKEPTKDEVTKMFFGIPDDEKRDDEELEGNGNGSSQVGRNGGGGGMDQGVY